MPINKRAVIIVGVLIAGCSVRPDIPPQSSVGPDLHPLKPCFEDTKELFPKFCHE